MTEEIKTNFTKVFESHSDAIFRYCLMRVSDRETAKDLAQNAFLKTWDYLYRGKEVKDLKNFLYKVAHNLVIDYYRLKKTESLDRLAEDTGFDPTASEGASNEEEADASYALKLLDRIPPEYREVVVLRYVEGLSFKDIAGITGESENTVTVRFHRAIEKLKKIFDPEMKN